MVVFKNVMLVRMGVIYFEMPLGFMLLCIIIKVFFFQILQVDALVRILNSDYY